MGSNTLSRLAGASGDLYVLEPGDGVVAVEALLEHGPGDHRPAEHPAEPELVGHGVREGGLAGAGVAGDQQRPAQVERGVDRFEFLGTNDICFGVSRAFGDGRAQPVGFIIDNVDFVTVGEQTPGQMRPDEAGPAGDENSHETGTPCDPRATMSLLRDSA